MARTNINPIVPILFSAYFSVSTAYTAGQILKFDTKDFDTTNSYNTTTGQFTAPFTGYYLIQVTGRYTAGSGSGLDIFKNNATYARADEINGSTANAAGGIPIFLNKNDVLDLRSGNSTTWGGLISGQRTSTFSVTRLPTSFVE